MYTFTAFLGKEELKNRTELDGLLHFVLASCGCRPRTNNHPA
jgi:hypothetical protein